MAKADEILVIEGELNGMTAHLAFREAGVPVAVMGVAGAHGRLHPQVLRDKQVYVYADDDTAGKSARSRWRRDAERAGSHRVRVLPALAQDACECASENGRPYLAACLLKAMHSRRKSESPLRWAA